MEIKDALENLDWLYYSLPWEDRVSGKMYEVYTSLRESLEELDALRKALQTHGKISTP